MLHDTCHGSIYNFAGERIGGPSPWTLDELVVTVRDGRVYASTSAVIPGRWVAGGR
jgi:Rieske Fe-S protein